MISLDKSLIKQRFEKSIGTYTQEAIVQFEMNIQLTDMLLSQFSQPFDRVLEIGCGTMTLSDQLLQKASVHHYILNDLYKDVTSLEKVKRAYPKTQFSFQQGDAEQISFPSSLDLIVSGSTFQWFSSLELFLEKLHGTLNKGGVVAFSTFGSSNLREIRSITGKGLAYDDFTHVKKTTLQHFDIIDASESEKRLFFDTPKDVLYHLKNTGVNGVSNGHKWGKAQFIHFHETYKVFAEAQGYPLTYHPMLFIIQKR